MEGTAALGGHMQYSQTPSARDSFSHHNGWILKTIYALKSSPKPIPWFMLANLRLDRRARSRSPLRERPTKKCTEHAE